MGFRATLAGQDITAYVQEATILVKDTLGQGVGMGGGGYSGRAATCEFLTTLGPVASAVGAGTNINSPTLVRQGEVIIYDSNNNAIFGGFTGKLTDQSEAKQVYTKVECYDYWQELDRYQVQQVYSGATDIFMIKDLLTKYASWLDRSALTSSGSYTFTAKNFKAITLQKALSVITDVTGYQIWIDPYKKVHYVYPTNGVTAPFNLSTAPDFVSSFQYGVTDYEIDDTAAINRVVFYGGKKPSNNFTQDLSTQANGSNTLFVLAYYPRYASDGVFHIQAQSINGGNDLVYGYLLGTGTKNQFKSAGGLADVLINADAHTLQFDVAPANNGPNSVTMTFRFEAPMVIQLTNQASYNYYGRWYDGIISDQTIFDSPTAIGRCKTLLNEQSMGLTTVKFKCWKPGLQAGQLVHLFHSVKGINNTYIIQEVDTVPLGAGNFEYQVQCGGWNWNIVDAIINTAQAAYAAGLAPINDNANGQQTNAVQVQQPINDTVKITETSWSTKTRTWGTYYARLTALNDGQDAYAGLFSIKT